MFCVAVLLLSAAATNLSGAVLLREAVAQTLSWWLGFVRNCRKMRTLRRSDCSSQQREEAVRVSLVPSRKYRPVACVSICETLNTRDQWLKERSRVLFALKPTR